jgi:hypothetical protein
MHMLGQHEGFVWDTVFPSEFYLGLCLDRPYEHGKRWLSPSSIKIPAGGPDVGVSPISVTPMQSLPILILRTMVGPWEGNVGKEMVGKKWWDEMTWKKWREGDVGKEAGGMKWRERNNEKKMEGKYNCLGWFVTNRRVSRFIPKGGSWSPCI